MKPQIHVLFTSRLFQQVLAYIGSPKICMHASKYACMRPIHAVQKYACMRPSMHACVQVCKFGSIQRCSAEKKRWAAHWGAVQRCFAGKYSMFSTLGGCPTMFRWKNQVSA